MVFMPPQHGKSELTTRRMPAFVLGKKPEKRIGIGSYSSTYAKGFNMAIQRIIDSDEYHELFPDTYLNKSNVSDKDGGQALRNTETFELVGQRGSLRISGIDGGSLTGNPLDMFILDDPYASREDAMSNAINEAVWSFYINVARMRMHNNTQELVVMTRWHENDIASRLLAAEKDWVVVSYPAIKDRENEDDPRKIGEALWEDHLSLEKIRNIEKLSRVTFDASYQQNPQAPKEVLVYPNWKKIKAMPAGLPVFYGGDFGFSNDPTAVVEMAINKNRLYLREILYKPGLTNKGIVKALESLGISIKKKFIWDSSEPKSIKELQLLGMRALAAVKGPGSVMLGVNEIKELEIYVTADSHNLIAELNAYQFEVYGGKITNDIIDKHNHLMDAMRYGYLNRHLNQKLKV